MAAIYRLVCKRSLGYKAELLFRTLRSWLYFSRGKNETRMALMYRFYETESVSRCRKKRRAKSLFRKSLKDTDKNASPEVRDKYQALEKLQIKERRIKEILSR